WSRPWSPIRSPRLNALRSISSTAISSCAGPSASSGSDDFLSWRRNRRRERGVMGEDPVARQGRRRRILAIVAELLARLQLHAAGARLPFGLVGRERRAWIVVLRQVARERVGVLERDGGPLRQRRHHRMCGVAEQRDAPAGPARQRIAVV